MNKQQYVGSQISIVDGRLKYFFGRFLSARLLVSGLAGVAGAWSDRVLSQERMLNNVPTIKNEVNSY